MIRKETVSASNDIPDPEKIKRKLIYSVDYSSSDNENIDCWDYEPSDPDEHEDYWDKEDYGEIPPDNHMSCCVEMIKNREDFKCNYDGFIEMCYKCLDGCKYSSNYQPDFFCAMQHISSWVAEENILEGIIINRNLNDIYTISDWYNWTLSMDQHITEVLNS